MKVFSRVKGILWQKAMEMAVDPKRLGKAKENAERVPAIDHLFDEAIRAEHLAEIRENTARNAAKKAAEKAAAEKAAAEKAAAEAKAQAEAEQKAAAEKKAEKKAAHEAKMLRIRESEASRRAHKIVKPAHPNEVMEVMDDFKTVKVMKVAQSGRMVTCETTDAKGNIVPLDIRKRVDPAMQYLIEQSGLDDMVEVKLCQDLSGFEENRKEAALKWLSEVHHGERELRLKSGRIIKSFGHGTNQGKKDEVIFTFKERIPELFNWMDCGARADTMKMTVAKYVAYHGLLMVATDDFGFPISPEEVFVCDTDGEYTIEAVAKTVGGDEVSAAIPSKVKEKGTDGTVYFWVPGMKVLSWEKEYGLLEAEAMKEAWNALSDGTIRAPWTKGQFVLFPWQEYLKRRGVTELNGRPVDDYIMCFDRSVFKAKIGDSDGTAYKSWDEYCTAFHALGHRYGVLLHDLPRSKKDMPTQQVDAMSAASIELKEAVAQYEVEYLNERSTVNGAAKFLPKAAQIIGSAYPEFLNLPWCRKRMNDAYRTKYDQGRAGKVHGVAQYHFMQKDPIAGLCYRFHLDMEYAIPEGICFTKCGLVGKGIISRNPSPTPQSASEVTFTGHLFGKYSDLFEQIKSNTLFLSWKGVVASKADADFDGDEGFATTDERIVACYESSISKLGDYVVTWNAPSGTPCLITEEAIAEYFSNLTERNDLGLYCDYTSVIYARYPLDLNLDGKNPVEITIKWMTKNGIADIKFRPEPQRALDWLKYAINVLVDASKHVGGTGEKIELPDFVDKLVNHYVFNEDDGTWTKERRPFAKSTAYGKVKKAEWKGTKCNVKYQHSNNAFTEVIGDAVGENCRTAVEGESSLDFEFAVLTSENKKMRATNKLLGKDLNEALCRRNKKDPGVWDEIVTMHASAWKAAIADEHLRSDIGSLEDKKREVAINILKKYAEKNGYTFESVVDHITSYTFGSICQMTDESMEGVVEVYMSAYINILGDIIAKYAMKNKGLEPIAADVVVEEIEGEYEEAND